jgi:hypothetical protein
MQDEGWDGGVLFLFYHEVTGMRRNVGCQEAAAPFGIVDPRSQLGLESCGVALAHIIHRPCRLRPHQHMSKTSKLLPSPSSFLTPKSTKHGCGNVVPPPGPIATYSPPRGPLIS